MVELEEEVMFLGEVGRQFYLHFFVEIRVPGKTRSGLNSA